MTPEQYHNTESEHGKYQYVSLQEIVNDMLLLSQDDDSYLKNTKRSQILYFARQGIKLVNRQAASDVYAISFEVSPSLYFILPQDYIEYVRVSVVLGLNGDNSKRLYTLDINRNMNISRGYLQDHNYEILFDNNGQILTADGDNVYGQAYSTYKFCGCASGTGSKTDTSKLSEYGEFTIDERNGRIAFSSNLMEKEIVLEYVSDGLQNDLSEEEITVHKYCEETIKDWIYYCCIAQRRTVPANEKQRALQRHKTTLHQSKLARANFDYQLITRVLRKKAI